MKIFGWNTTKRKALLLTTVLYAIAMIAATTQIDLTTQVKGILPIANGGTGTGNSATGTAGGVVLSTSPTIQTPTISGDLGGNLSLGTFALVTSIANDTVTGTTANLLAKLTSTSKVIITGTGDTSGIVGVCIGNCGTSGSATIAIEGQIGCIADNSITQNDYIVEGTTTVGRCKSIGASPPTANQVIGRSLTTTSAGSTATIFLFGPNIPDTASAVTFVDDETPSGTINGANTSFTLANSPNPAASLMLFKNGQKLEPSGLDYTLSGATVTATVAPKTGDVLIASYRR